MSQQSQAEGLQQRAVQAASELERRHTELLKKKDAGELTGEALAAEEETIRDLYAETDALVEQAAKLNTIKSRATTLSSQMTKPNLQRPLVAQGDGAAGDPGGHVPSATRYEEVSAIIASTLSTMGHVDPEVGPVLPQGSPERALLNKYLRPKTDGLPGSEIRAQLTKRDMEFLHRPRTERLLNPYVDPDGGWIVAQEMRNEMIQLRVKEVGIINRFRDIQTTASEVAFPTAQVTFSFTKRAKTGQGAVTEVRLTDVFGKTRFSPTGRDVILKVPEQLVEDATFDLVRFIAEEANRVSREEDELLGIRGSGSSEPLGYVNAMVQIYDSGATDIGRDPDGTDVPTFSGGAFNDKFIQVFDTYLMENARRNAVWTGPRVFERKVRLFKTEPGGDDTGEYLFKRALEAGAPNTLNGFPLLISEFWEDNITSGSTGDPMWHFGDLGDYWWVTRQGLRVRVLDQTFAATSEIGYKYDKRQDGCLVRGDGNIYARRQA